MLGGAAMLGVILLTAPAAAQTEPAAENKPPLVWAADIEGGAPYIFLNPANSEEKLGFEVEIAAALAGQMRREIVFQPYAFVNLIQGLQRRDFDLAMNGLEVLPERRQQILMSRPYYVYRLQLSVRENETRINSANDLKPGHTVGTLGNTAAERWLKEHGIEPRVYDNQVDPYRDLALGRTDAVLLDLPIALYYGQNEAAIPHAQPIRGVRFAGPPIARGYYSIGVSNDRPELVEEINKALDAMIADGSLQRILERWQLWNPDQELLPQARLDDLGAATERRGYAFREYFPQLWAGAVLTVKLSVASMALAVALGLPIAMMRLYGGWPLRWLATVYVEFFRGIPVLLLLYFLYFGLPSLSQTYGFPWELKLSPFAAGLLGFGINYAAYEAEIYRAGLSAIPQGQWEAAASLGMTKWQTFWRIILPQAVRIILPPMTNDFVALFKDTSVVSVIAVVELTKQYSKLANHTGQHVEIGLTAAALYLAMSVPLAMLARMLERRWTSR